MNDVARRALLVSVLVGAVVAGGVVDDVVGRPAPPSVLLGANAVGAFAVASALGAEVAPARVESSAGYCPASTDSSGPSTMTVVLTNTTAKAVTGTITTVSTAGSSAPAPVRVPAGDQIGVTPPNNGSGGYVAATVVLSGGGVGISEQVSGPLGYAIAPCATAPGTQWYFAHGSTASGDSLQLALFNPGDAPAVIDVGLATSLSGYVQPPAYQGVEVPAGSLVVENIADHAINDPDVATNVTALSGSVVAGQLQQLGSSGQGGLSVMLGAPSTEAVWSFPYNDDVPGATVAFHIFNPSTKAARLSMDIVLAQGSAEPIAMDVPAMSATTVVAENEIRIPTSGDYSARFVCRGDAGVVIDREVTTSSTSAPAPQQGETAGVPLGGSRWLIAIRPPAANGTAVLAFANTSTRRITMRVSIMARGRWVALTKKPTTIRAGGFVVEGPNAPSPAGDVPLEVTANGPLTVELDPLPAGAIGVTTGIALPLG